MDTLNNLLDKTPVIVFRQLKWLNPGGIFFFFNLNLWNSEKVFHEKGAMAWSYFEQDWRSLKAVSIVGALW